MPKITQLEKVELGFEWSFCGSNHRTCALNPDMMLLGNVQKLPSHPIKPGSQEDAVCGLAPVCTPV